jgi:hypothetical protein
MTLHIIARDSTLTSFLLESLPASLRDNNTHLHPMFPRGPFHALLRTLDAVLHFKTPYLRSFAPGYVKGLATIPADASVLVFDIENLKELKILKKHFSARRVSLFLWNPVTNFRQARDRRMTHLQAIKGLGFRIFTFDPADAAKYRLALTDQVYRRVESYREALPIEHEVYFLGKEKGRLKALQKLGAEMQARGVRANLVVVTRDEMADLSGVVTISQEEVGYLQNLCAINQAKCLLELTQATQSGLTIRAMEALFFGKKLITDNALVRQLPFYHPDLFFILGHDDWGRIATFLQSETPQLTNADLARFEFPKWIRQFEI